MQPIFRFLQLLCENHNRDLVGILLFIVHAFWHGTHYVDPWLRMD